LSSSPARDRHTQFGVRYSRSVDPQTSVPLGRRSRSSFSEPPRGWQTYNPSELPSLDTYIEVKRPHGAVRNRRVVKQVLSRNLQRNSPKIITRSDVQRKIESLRLPVRSTAYGNSEVENRLNRLPSNSALLRSTKNASEKIDSGSVGPFNQIKRKTESMLSKRSISSASSRLPKTSFIASNRIGLGVERLPTKALGDKAKRVMAVRKKKSSVLSSINENAKIETKSYCQLTCLLSVL
jgi:hypothetical protein